MALSCDNSLVNLCSFVYLLPPDSSLSASQIYLRIAISSFGGLIVSFYRPSPTIVLFEKMAQTNDPENFVGRARQTGSERNIFHINGPKFK
jgi:hypothetical protein